MHSIVYHKVLVRSGSLLQYNNLLQNLQTINVLWQNFLFLPAVDTSLAAFTAEQADVNSTCTGKT